MPALAASLNDLAKVLAELGRLDLTAADAQEAADHYRALAEATPEAYLPHLAMSLNNLAVLLAPTGRRNQPLAPAQEAADHFRRLAEAWPDVYSEHISAAAELLVRLQSDQA